MGLREVVHALASELASDAGLGKTAERGVLVDSRRVVVVEEGESMTLIFESDEGAIHSPPMKKLSVWVTGVVASSEMVMRASQLSAPDSHGANPGTRDVVSM